MEKQLTGVELIAKERQEQIEKHGFTEQYQKDHLEYYSDGQLIDAAHYAITLKGWPQDWPKGYYRDKIVAKSYKDRLIIAGALIAAEIDRLNYNKNDKDNF